MALAASEAEAWMLLFPKALDEFRTGWRVPTARRNKDTGMLRKAAELGLLSRPKGTNRSYKEFLADAEKLAGTL